MRSTQNDRQPALKGGRFSMKQKFLVSYKLSHVPCKRSVTCRRSVNTDKNMAATNTMQYVVRLTRENKATGTNWL